MRTFFVSCAGVLLAGLLSSCTDDPGEPAEDPSEQLSRAQTVLDEAASLDVSITVTDLPPNVSGLTGAEGVADRSPAFEGDVTVVTGGSTIQAQVIAMSDTTWVKTSFSPAFVKLDPASLNAPNPADLIGSPGEGLPALLGKIVEPSRTGSSRDGDLVLTSIVGTLAGDEIARLLPSASAEGSFDVTVRLTDDGILHDMKINGAFYGDRDASYTVVLTARDSAVTIEAP